MGAADGFTDSGELDGLTVYDTDGEKVGSVGRVYVDDNTGRPDWITVKTGLFGMKESFVPLAGARRVGSDLHISHPKDRVKEAPRVDADAHLSVAEEEELYNHYGLATNTTAKLGGRSGKATGTGTATASGTGTTAMGSAGTAGAAGAGAMGAAGAGRTTGSDRTAMTGPTASGTGTARTTSSGMGQGMHRDTGAAGTSRPPVGAGAGSERSSADLRGKEEMIRSEEQLHVGTEQYESGTARLHKYVVTENVTRTVPVTHEEVRLIREPLQPGEKTAERAAIREQDVEVTLHAERATTRKETVPVERVRMETKKVTEQKEVSAELRKEQIDYTDSTDIGGKDMGGDIGRGRRR
ncbi:PRC and DUF2382 domain-containing protein [Streptomyces sp. NBC_01591]|uniref:PRC and DUF2382 domain-containing protein n=1 Tax=Streptomyces sp. NBC_01591 TaxID=2975888 RepID=UPI002DD98223|nr:PRC and DUF2382 domain-containing protein [Streptomyces sp. NBC_01591]WSD66733.1 PRC and DUF2382 domain-containing protein [Streptomyces sp. NBC_01591]